MFNILKVLDGGMGGGGVNRSFTDKIHYASVRQNIIINYYTYQYFACMRTSF